MISKQTKTNQVKKLQTAFEKSKAAFVVNCIGLNVEEMTNLRKTLKKADADIQVIKNTLSKLSMEKEEALKKAYEPFNKGPNAFVVAFNDGLQVAKIIDDFAKEHEAFEIKAGVLDDKILSLENVKALANLPSHDVLKAQFLGLLQAPMTKFVLTLKEVPQKFVRALKVYSETKPAEETKPEEKKPETKEEKKADAETEKKAPSPDEKKPESPENQAKKSDDKE